MRTRRPISVNNSLAHGICNYSCRLCSVNKPNYQGPKTFQPRAVTAALIARIQDAAAAGIHVRYVANAGDGEPTLHPEFPERMALFGDMLRNWNAPVPAPEVSVVTNGSRLTQPGILEAMADHGLSLIVSFPTPDPESYGEIMVGEPARGPALLDKVIPGIEAAMALAASNRLAALYFHISPPERDIVRRDFASTLSFLTKRAANAGLKEITLIMFPATSNRSGLVRNWVGGTDMYGDLFREANGKTVNGVTVRMKLVLKRFFANYAEIADLVRSFRFPCLWNANLFIAADGASICCNDQAVRHPMGNIVDQSLDQLMSAKEDHRPGRTCAGCDQRPERTTGSPAACLFALAARMRLAVAGKPARPRPIPAFEYRFGGDGRYTARVAAGSEDRRKAWELVYRLYREKGYAEPSPEALWYGIHDALPDTCTLLVEQEGEPVGALTLVLDSPLRLPADELYQAELRDLRARGRRPCEIVSLVCAEKNLRHGAEIVKHLFKLAYLAASRLAEATDFLITVNPRHVRFYERTLLMTRCGPERAYGKVSGAPAVLLNLDLTTAEQRYADHYGRRPGSLFRFFVDPAAEPAILAMLTRHHAPLNSAALREYFMIRRPLLQGLPRPLRHYIEECYPGYNLDLLKTVPPDFRHAGSRLSRLPSGSGEFPALSADARVHSMSAHPDPA